MSRGSPQSLLPPQLKDSEGIAQFIQEFIRHEATREAGTPSIMRCLDIEKKHPKLATLIKGLGPSPRVLFQGYTAPSNADAFRQFLASFDCKTPELHALDLHDIPAIYGHLNIPIPAITFHVSDAAKSATIFNPGEISIVIQHGLGNCAPPPHWPSIQTEAARLLAPLGFGLFVFSEIVDSSAIPQLTTLQFETMTGATWNPLALGLPAYDLDSQLTEKLLGHIILDPESDVLTLITKPVGRFEFFAPFSRFESTLTAANLTIRSRITSSGVDNNGMICRRNHCLVGPA